MINNNNTDVCGLLAQIDRSVLIWNEICDCGMHKSIKHEMNRCMYHFNAATLFEASYDRYHDRMVNRCECCHIDIPMSINNILPRYYVQLIQFPLRLMDQTFFFSPQIFYSQTFVLYFLGRMKIPEDFMYVKPERVQSKE